MGRKDIFFPPRFLNKLIKCYYNIIMNQIEELLTRGVEEVIDKAHLESLLKSKKKLRVKLGIDPTSPNIHIGRSVALLKLRQFQDLGHKVVLIVGDFTGIIGDTSDKESERPMMTEKQLKANMKTYEEQAFKILDKKKTEIRYNSEWLKSLGFKEIGEMADLFSLHEFEARENISKRMKAGKRVSLREVLYPLMQGYDSVGMKADIEIGGTDQRFNLLAGRTIQPLYKQKPQDILMTTLMEGTDGRKMSSSWGNVINVMDEPNDMFGKVMSIADGLIKKYFVLATRVEITEIDEIMKLTNPRDQKLVLAEKLTALYHGEKKAVIAKENFANKFGKKTGEISADFEISKEPGNYLIVDILVEGGLAASKSEARRKIKEGAVEVDGVKIKDESAKAAINKNSLIRLGKRFLKIK